MITARLLRAAIRNNVELSALTWNGKIKKPKPKARLKKAGMLPPPPKAQRVPRVVEKGFVWDDLQKVMRLNSAHGFARVVHEALIQPVSGRDLRRRIHALGLTATQFARRHGMTVSSLYDMTHYPAGALLTRYIRLVEFEEFMDGVATILEDEKMTAETIRSQLGTMLDEQISRL